MIRLQKSKFSFTAILRPFVLSKLACEMYLVCNVVKVEQKEMEIVIFEKRESFLKVFGV